MTLISTPANPVPEGAVTGVLKTPDGVALRFARWAPPQGRKGTLLVLPEVLIVGVFAQPPKRVYCSNTFP